MTGDKQHDATTEFNEALAAGFAAGAFDAIGPFYTEDASLLPPRGKMLNGRAAASAFWLGVANRFKSVVFTTVALKDLGDAARRETGTYVMGGGEGQAAEGKYVFVWQFVDGEWQIESSIWNRNGETGGQRQGQGQGGGQRRQGGVQGGVGGQGGGYRRGGGGQGAGQGGYRQGGGRPSFQQGGGGAGRRPGGGRQGGPGEGQDGGSLYDGNAGLYANPKG